MRRESSRWLMIKADVENKTGPRCGLSQRPGNGNHTCEEDASKRPLEESELMPWHPSAINLALLPLTQKHWSRNCAEVTPRSYSSATCWRWNDMWKTEKANVHIKICKAHIGGMPITKRDTILPLFLPFLVQKTHLTRWYWGRWDIITQMLLYHACARPQCDKLDARLQVCDTDEWNFWGMHSAAASSERKLNTNPINKMNFESPDANFFPFLRPGVLTALCCCCWRQRNENWIVWIFMILHRFTISINGKPGSSNTGWNHSGSLIRNGVSPHGCFPLLWALSHGASRHPWVLILN